MSRNLVQGRNIETLSLLVITNFILFAGLFQNFSVQGEKSQSLKDSNIAKSNVWKISHKKTECTFIGFPKCETEAGHY